MSALAFWKAVVDDKSDFLDRILASLAENGIRYCVIGGFGVNAYAEPLVTQDLDIVIAVDQLDEARDLFGKDFKVKDFEHSINVYDPNSGLQVQVQRDRRYEGFELRSSERMVMGVRLPVAAPEDVLQGKIWAASDSGRRPSKRQKDLADILRLIEAFPELRSDVPQDILDRLF